MSQALDCDRIENDLALHVGGELSAHAGAAIARHLDGCPACALRVERLQASRLAFRRGLDRSSERVPDLWSGIRGRLIEGQLLAETREPALPERAPASAARSGRLLRLPRWASAAAAAGLIFALGLWIGNRPDAPGQTGLRPATQRPAEGSGSVARADPRPAPSEGRPGGLRRLAQEEAPLSRTALTFEEAFLHSGSSNGAQPASATTPVSLRRGLQ